MASARILNAGLERRQCGDRRLAGFAGADIGDGPVPGDSLRQYTGVPWRRPESRLPGSAAHSRSCSAPATARAPRACLATRWLAAVSSWCRSARRGRSAATRPSARPRHRRAEPRREPNDVHHDRRLRSGREDRRADRAAGCGLRRVRDPGDRRALDCPVFVVVTARRCVGMKKDEPPRPFAQKVENRLRIRRESPESCKIPSASYDLVARSIEHRSIRNKARRGRRPEGLDSP